MTVDIFPSLKELTFLEKYPDSDLLCLEVLWKHYAAQLTECPKCHSEPKFYRVEGRRSWSCSHCGLHLSPTAGTIFHKSVTPLHKWFIAIKLIYQSNGAIPAQELSRRLNLYYKTAWRMKNQICLYLELDKSYSYKYSSATKPIPPGRTTSAS